MPSLRPSLLAEDLPPLGPPSRPSSPWSAISSVLREGVLGERTLSGGYASKIPVLAGSPARYNPPFHFYSEIGDEEDMFEHARLRFADPPPTLNSKIFGINGDDDGLGDDAEVWDEYVEEAKEYDTELIGELNGSLDVLLIFVSRSRDPLLLVTDYLVGRIILCSPSR